MHEKPLGFANMHGNNIFFCVFEMRKKFILDFVLKFQRKPSLFNTISVSYSVIL